MLPKVLPPGPDARTHRHVHITKQKSQTDKSCPPSTPCTGQTQEKKKESSFLRVCVCVCVCVCAAASLRLPCTHASSCIAAFGTNCSVTASAGHVAVLGSVQAPGCDVRQVCLQSARFPSEQPRSTQASLLSACRPSLQGGGCFSHAVCQLGSE